MIVEKRDHGTSDLLFMFGSANAKVSNAEAFNRLALEIKIPVYNLYYGDWISDLSEQIRDKANEAKALEALAREVSRRCTTSREDL